MNTTKKVTSNKEINDLTKMMIVIQQKAKTIPDAVEYGKLLGFIQSRYEIAQNKNT